MFTVLNFPVASPPRRRDTRPAHVPKQEAPRPDAVPAEEPTELFLTEFLRILSKQTGEDFMRHADIFVDFGVTERVQFQRLYEKPMLMEKISKRLRDTGRLKVWAISNIEEFIVEYFSGNSGAVKA
ncbi:hypothetical protein NM688_g6138 [Phlebia brevispora]|uniref:Uncharacterized protein n=1 Tax=Phlebia brevispora TaxID=194682 RepID=A0ACC1SJM0_9APHY|nr:hypothetical protein NM688_g6138 [Phlebia brevispora]